MTFRNALMSLAFIPLLAACSPNILASTPAAVTVGNVTDEAGDLPRATAVAQAECQRYGRDAARVPDGQADGIVQFDCR